MRSNHHSARRGFIRPAWLALAAAVAGLTLLACGSEETTTPAVSGGTGGAGAGTGGSGDAGGAAGHSGGGDAGAAGAAGGGQILWSGTVESGSFEEYHFNSDTGHVIFPLVHAYGRPPNYSNANHVQEESGNGELLDIVSQSGSDGFDFGPARVGDKAIRFRVKNSNDSTDPIDQFDPASGTPPTDNTRQRSALSDTKFTVDVTSVQPVVPILPNNGPERWVSLSIYLESDFPVHNQDTGFMTLWGLKAASAPDNTAYAAPIRGWLGLLIGNGGWVFRDTWMGDTMWSQGITNQDYRYAFYYGKDGANLPMMDIHYPDFAASTAMLGDLNRGGWTDVIWHFKTDTADDNPATNTGFVDIYMRHNLDPWTHVLALRPIQVTYDGVTYDKGIGLHGTNYTSFAQGIYCSTGRVWFAPTSAVAYFDNPKVGDEHVTFAQMSPDGSSL